MHLGVSLFTMLSPLARRQRIADLLADQPRDPRNSRNPRNPRNPPITSQEQLQEMLARQRIIVTQATLSRDLRELGVLKGPDGYHLPSAGGEAALNGTSARAASARTSSSSGGGASGSMAATLVLRDLERLLASSLLSAEL